MTSSSEARQISISKTLHEKLLAYCDVTGLSLDAAVESALEEWFVVIAEVAIENFTGIPASDVSPPKVQPDNVVSFPKAMAGSLQA